MNRIDYPNQFFGRMSVEEDGWEETEQMRNDKREESEQEEEVWELQDDQEDIGLAPLDEEEPALDDAGIAPSDEEEVDLTPLSDEPVGELSPLDDIEELTALDDSASTATGAFAGACSCWVTASRSATV